MKVVIVAPVAPPYGGMALQARQLERLLRRDGVDASICASNFALPFRIMDRVPVLRTCARASLIWFRLWSSVRHADVVHILAASWLYFFVVVGPAVLVGRACRARVVLNYRGGDAKAFFAKYGWLARLVFTRASTVTAPSEFLAVLIRKRFDLPVTIVPNIVDSSRFTYQPRPRVRPNLLVTRHLEEIYDIESVIKAFGLVQQRYAEASLWIAGTGSQAASLRHLADTMGLGNVRFLGEVDHADLPDVYGQRDIYVNASRIDNFPGALLEASAAGLVVVTTNAGGIPLIYENERTALLVDVGDWLGLAERILYVVEHPDESIALTGAALAIVRSCDWKEVWRALAAVYDLQLVDGTVKQTDSRGEQCVDG